MLGIPSGDEKRVYDFMRPLLRDAGEPASTSSSRRSTCSRTSRRSSKQEDYIGVHRSQLMDKHGIEQAHDRRESRRASCRRRALRSHPDRFFGSARRRTRTTAWTGCASSCTLHEQLRHQGGHRVPVRAAARRCRSTTREWYPIYAKCVELDLRSACCVGVPGPRLPMAPQHVELLDEVCWFFPELKFVMRHGAEPWTDLAVKLMLKWPNLYYSTSAFAPQALPEGDHRLREHARRRQDHVRGLLPDGAHARAHLRRAAGRAVQRRRLAEVPARERVRVFKL